MAAASTIKYLKLPSLIFSILLLIHGASGAVSIAASDTLNNGGNITDGETTLVSAGGSFTLGFFSPNRVPIKRYLGIWFTVSPDAVYWVANRDAPLNNTSGVLVISPSGILRLLDGGAGQTAWASNTTGAVSSSSVVAQLLESGNLVVLEKSSGAILWQSFDHPSNTLLSGMKLGKSPKTGAEWSLTSWRSQDDPATGSYRRVMDTKGLPDIVTWQGNVKKYRSGPWNGRWFSGVPDMASDFKLFSVQMLGNYDEVTYVLNATAGSTFTRFVLDEAGKVQVLMWIQATRAWRSFPWSPRDGCDDYAACGAFGLCSDAAAAAASAPSCSCVEGFSPVNQSEFSGGCQRDVQLECRNGRTTDEFTVVRGVKLPDTDNTTVAERVTLEQCRAMCLVDCSCVAYAPAYIRGGGGVGSGCVTKSVNNNIVDVRYIDNGQDLYVRLAKAELDIKKRTDASPWRGPKPELFYYLRKRKKRNMVIILLPVTACLLALAGMFLVWIWCKLRGKRPKKDFQKKMMLGYFDAPNTLDDENIDLPFFSFGDIVSATNTFAEDNMLGKGGFGKVYKGMLGDKNKEVAIKRLSQGSGQGIDEFRNEVVLIARLQHRNLVRLLGYCILENEKLLIYEYLPNKSLDFFIFDAASKKVLDWPTRFRIIKGISRGLLYLHQDSRLAVVHRDLKPSNILLDADMNPKISDFGMARIFGGNQQEANTNRVVGTYGYMSPEYAMDGAFSVRSDVYSFGVILLEIISGMRISTTHFTDFANLLAYAWSLWKDGKAIDLVDTSLLETCSTTEALRCIHIGLLCVQDNPNSRPLMSSVVLMLENEATPLSVPKQPLYFSQWYLEAQETGENSNKSTNKMSVTVLQGR